MLDPAQNCRAAGVLHPVPSNCVYIDVVCSGSGRSADPYRRNCQQGSSLHLVYAPLHYSDKSLIDGCRFIAAYKSDIHCPGYYLDVERHGRRGGTSSETSSPRRSRWKAGAGPRLSCRAYRRRFGKCTVLYPRQLLALTGIVSQLHPAVKAPVLALRLLIQVTVNCELIVLVL